MGLVVANGVDILTWKNPTNDTPGFMCVNLCMQID